MPSTTESARRADADPYRFDRSGNPLMTTSIVLWLDILGYQQMIKDAKTETQQADVLRRLHAAISEHRAELEPEESDGRRNHAIRAFTDNIVIGWPIFDDAEFEAGHTLIKAASYQLRLAIEGFFVRGALSIGPHFMDDYVVFGPALLEAYTIESEVAVHPRVALSAGATDVLRKHLEYYAEPASSPQNRAILVDGDIWFLNYLYVACLDDSPEVVSEYRSLVALHRDSVSEALREHAGHAKVTAKYLWLASYHNYVCESMYPGDTEVCIPGIVAATGFRHIAA